MRAVDMIDVSVIRDRAELDRLRDRWSHLLSLMPEPSFAQTYEGFRAALDAAAEPRVFAVTAAGKILGLWPMRRVLKKTAFGGVRVLTDGATGGTCAGPVGPRPATTAAVVARHLRTSGDWDAVSLADVRGSKGEPGPASAAFAAVGLLPAVRSVIPLIEIELAGRWADVLAGCDARVRLAVYRAQHADNRGEFEFDRVRTAAASGVPRQLDAALALAEPDARPRLRPLLEEACRRGAGDIALLRSAGRVVGAAVSLVSRGVLESRFVAVAPGAPPLSGVRLLSDLLRDSLARRDRRFTFAAPPGHLALGWAEPRRERVDSEVRAPGRSMIRLDGFGARLRGAFRRAPAAASV